MLTFGSLFAGIGGIDLGLERAGMVCKWQVEIDLFCQNVLAKHWPNVRKYADARECGRHNLETVDLICGGFPCQDISGAGKKKGIEGEKSGLWTEFYRIICELRPRYALVENVSALLVRGIGTVLGDLASCGYDAEWQSLSAAAFGAPHRRDRVFIVAYPNSINGNKGLVFHDQHAREIFDEGDRNRASIWRQANAPHPRVVDGPLTELDKHRVRAIGNAVVPQVAEWIGRRIIELDRRGTCTTE